MISSWRHDVIETSSWRPEVMTSSWRYEAKVFLHFGLGPPPSLLLPLPPHYPFIELLSGAKIKIKNAEITLSFLLQLRVEEYLPSPTSLHISLLLCCSREINSGEVLWSWSTWQQHARLLPWWNKLSADTSFSFLKLQILWSSPRVITISALLWIFYKKREGQYPSMLSKTQSLCRLVEKYI